MLAHDSTMTDVHAQPKQTTTASGKPVVPRRPKPPPKVTDRDVKPRLHLDVLEKTHTTDLAELVSGDSLPVCIKVLSPFATHGCPVTIQPNDVLMLHLIDQTQIVSATDSKGRRYRLPVYAKQLYTVLPLDPRLDDKTYRGTANLVLADPCPTAVRVVEGFYSDNEDDTKEIDDIIYIKEIRQEGGNKVLVGDSEGYALRYRDIQDSAVYTTMIYTEHLPMSRIIQLNMPVRVRAVNDTGLGRDPKLELVLQLNKVENEKRVLASRCRDATIFTIPLGTPISVEKITPPWTSVLALVKPIYDAVNTSTCTVDISKATLSEALQAIPQPLKKTQEKWLESHEGKLLAAKVAGQDRADLENMLAKTREELDHVTTELKTYTDGSHPAPIPPRPSPHPTSTGQLPPPATTTSDNDAEDSDLENYERVDVIPTKQDAPNVSQSLAQTDLEKVLKKVLDSKILELQERNNEFKNLQHKFQKLTMELTKERREVFGLKEELDILDDAKDCYDLMSPSPLIPPSVKIGKSKAGDGHPVTVNLLFRAALPVPTSPLQSHLSKKHPNLPLPSMPGSPSSLVDTSASRVEYDPPFRHLTIGDHQSLQPSYVDIDKELAGLIPPPLPPPLSPLPSQKRTPAFTPPPPGMAQSRLTDSIKLSQRTPPIPQRTAKQTGEVSAPSTDLSDYEVPYGIGTPLSSSCKSTPLSPGHEYKPKLYSNPSMADANIGAFTKEDVTLLLKSLNMPEQCVERFLDESVDGSLLLGIDEDMMIKDLGMTSFQARKLTIKIDEMTN